jgi:hypothetical protein
MLSRVRPGSGPVSRRSAPEDGDAQRFGRVGLAAVLFVAEDQRRRRLLLVGEARRARQRGAEGLVELAQALAVFGRERDGIAEAEPKGLVGALTPGEPFGLVGDQDDRLAGAAHRLGEVAVRARHAGARVDEEQHRVAVGERGLGLRAHAAG